MTVKELKEMIKDYNDEANVMFVSTSGIEWKLNPKISENPVQKDNNVVIYIT